MSEEDPYNVAEFRFRIANRHNRDMLEYQAEKAMMQDRREAAAGFSQAAGLYAIAHLIELYSGLGDDQ